MTTMASRRYVSQFVNSLWPRAVALMAVPTPLQAMTVKEPRVEQTVM